MILCPSCGYDNELGRIFCTRCGQKLEISKVIPPSNIRRKFRGGGKGYTSIGHRIVGVSLKLIGVISSAAVLAGLTLLLLPSRIQPNISSIHKDRLQSFNEKIDQLKAGIEQRKLGQFEIFESELNTKIAYDLELGRLPKKKNEEDSSEEKPEKKENTWVSELKEIKIKGVYVQFVKDLVKINVRRKWLWFHMDQTMVYECKDDEKAKVSLQLKKIILGRLPLPLRFLRGTGMDFFDGMIGQFKTDIEFILGNSQSVKVDFEKISFVVSEE